MLRGTLRGAFCFPGSARPFGEAGGKQPKAYFGVFSAEIGVGKFLRMRFELRRMSVSGGRRVNSCGAGFDNSAVPRTPHPCAESILPLLCKPYRRKKCGDKASYLQHALPSVFQQMVGGIQSQSAVPVFEHCAVGSNYVLTYVSPLNLHRHGLRRYPPGACLTLTSPDGVARNLREASRLCAACSFSVAHVVAQCYKTSDRNF